MKKILLIFLLGICVCCQAGVSTLDMVPLSLSTSGSITIPSSLYPKSSTQVYQVQGNITLTGDLSYIFSGTPQYGSQFTLWFDSTNINPSGHNIFIINRNFTSLLNGIAQIFVTCTWDGSSWIVTNQQTTIQQFLASYVTFTQFIDTLAGYARIGSLSDSLSNYAALNSPALTGTPTAPTPAITMPPDSSNRLATTASVQRAVNPLRNYALLSGATFSGPVRVPTIAGSTDNSTNAASTSFVQAVASSTINTVNTSLTTFTNLVTYDTLAAGTINISAAATGVFNTITASVITGNIVLTSNVYAGKGPSEITIMLPFNGAWTVTAGANMSFGAITGANTHISVLTLVWNPVTQTYIQKAFSQN